MICLQFEKLPVYLFTCYGSHPSAQHHWHNEARTHTEAYLTVPPHSVSNYRYSTQLFCLSLWPAIFIHAVSICSHSVLSFFPDAGIGSFVSTICTQFFHMSVCSIVIMVSPFNVLQCPDMPPMLLGWLEGHHWVRDVWLYVSLEVILGAGGKRTVWTRKRFTSGVCQDVCLQWSILTEPLSAVVAHKGLLPGVRAYVSL